MFPYYIMSDEPLNDDAVLTKPKQKKPRSDAQQEATKKMLLARDEKMKTTQKAIKKAVVEHLNSSAPPKVVSESEESEASEPEPEPVKKKVKAVAVSEAPPVPPPKKKEPKVIYQEESESEEEVVIVKKRKKPKKKTIIYEESESEEEAPPPPKPKPRETKTQQNARSGFKVSVPEVKPSKPQPVYYFAD
jgi:hypothetical protein